MILMNGVVSLATAQGQNSLHSGEKSPIHNPRSEDARRRDGWFLRGRTIAGQNSAELLRQAYLTKMEMRRRRKAALVKDTVAAGTSFSTLTWMPLGPVPLASDASGMGLQDYRQVSGRATAVAIDPADPSGNTVYVGGAQGGVWKSTTGANPTANSVAWIPITDDQATLSVGSIAIQPGNSDPARSLILVGAGEANDAADSYYGMGILRSADAGNSWSLVSTANGTALSFSGLGGTRMAFSSAQTNVAVAAMGISTEGAVDGASSANTRPGLYSSSDAGESWNYVALLDPGGVATDATSATSVAYNDGAGMFFAAIRHHGFYSSPDGVIWTRLSAQPGGNALSATACPPISSSNTYACPIFRGEIATLPGSREMYVWTMSLDTSGNSVDGGIWQSLNGGNSWTQINDAGIANCGDSLGCGVEQGNYNLELMAMPNGSATDLYAGAINIYKCSINTSNPSCNASGFVNLTHALGCDPIAAPAHVHPAQHAVAGTVPSAGNDAGGALIYFANDGGLYRALDGFTGFGTGTCSDMNQFDDLNQNLGSMTQIVSFSQSPTDENTMLAGAQGEGFPATNTATSNLSWGSVNGGDGGFNAINPYSASQFFVSNGDLPPGGLSILECSNGTNCHAQDFSEIVGSHTVGGDDGAFYVPFLLDPQSSTALIVGTCRVWRGSRAGGAYTVLSPNFDTLGSGSCSGSEVNLVRSLDAGGPVDGVGSQVIYATTDGPGPLNPTSTIGGNVWVTTNATAGPSAFSQVTQNINPNQFPISGVAVDRSDTTGKTAYVTIMGFTGLTGHVWQTTNAGATWSDFTGTGSTSLPDAPANAVVVDAGAHLVYVGTDMGVFASGTAAPSWSEVGPLATSQQFGFLPNAAVTALAIFNSGDQKLLRASTYGRGIWQVDLNPVPDFQLIISNSSLTVPLGQTATFEGSVTIVNGYASSITLSCVAGTTLPPANCSPIPPVMQPGITAFAVAASDAVGTYNFNIEGIGADANQTTHMAGVKLEIVSNASDFVLSEPTSFPTVKAGSTNTSGTTNITAVNNFTGTVTLSCSIGVGNGSCSVLPAVVSVFPSAVSVTVNATTLTGGNYQLTIQGVSGATAHILSVPFSVSDYQISGTQSVTIAQGGQGTANLNITANTLYSGQVNASCNVTAISGAPCVLVPPNPIIVASGTAVPMAATIGVPGNTAPGTYNVIINTQDTTGTPAHAFAIVVTVPPEDFVLIPSPPSSQTITSGKTTGAYNLTVAPNPAGSTFGDPVSLSCSQGLPPGAQCNFSPSTPVTPGSRAVNVVMTISTSAATGVGTYTVTVSGISGSISHSTAVSLIVSATPAIDFALTAAGVSSAAGQTVMAVLTLTSTASSTIQISVSCDDSSLNGALGCSLSTTNPVSLSAGSSVQLSATIGVPTTAVPGTYSIKATAQDSTGSQTFTFPLTIMQDFSLTSPLPNSQTITAGQTTGAYQFNVQPNPLGSSFPGAVALSCSGLPIGAQCIFSPPGQVTPGSTAVNVALSIQTSATSSGVRTPRSMYVYAFGLVLPGVVILVGSRRCRRTKWRTYMGIAVLCGMALSCISCSGPVSSGSNPNNQQGINPQNFTITIIGTSGALTHDTTVSLTTN